VFKPIAIGTAKIRRPGTGAGIGDGAVMGIAKFFNNLAYEHEEKLMNAQERFVGTR